MVLLSLVGCAHELRSYGVDSHFVRLTQWRKGVDLKGGRLPRLSHLLHLELALIRPVLEETCCRHSYA
jgi:hypothetical protein